MAIAQGLIFVIIGVGLLIERDWMAKEILEKQNIWPRSLQVSPGYAKGSIIFGAACMIVIGALMIVGVIPLQGSR